MDGVYAFGSFGKSAATPTPPRTKQVNDGNDDGAKISIVVEEDSEVESSAPSLSPCSSAKRRTTTTRRKAMHQLLMLSATATTAATTAASAATADSAMMTSSSTAAATPRETYWPLGKVAFSLLPLSGTYTRRATVMDTLIPSTLWTFDQIQGVVNVNVPVRMVVIKLGNDAGGGLWVHNPLAPTPQLLAYIRHLETLHGPVRHVVLGTVALEHKATFGPFAQYFPKATVWIQRGQWSFPVQLPIEYLGVTQSNEHCRILPSSQYIHGQRTLDEEIQSLSNEQCGRNARYWAKKNPNPPEWTTDIDYETLDPIHFKSVGAYSEAAFYHISTKTLIVTDAVCSVTDTPPLIIQEDPRALLYHARDTIMENVIDNEVTRRKGWRRMVQFGLVFFPSQIDVVPFDRAIQQALVLDEANPTMKILGQDAIPFGGSIYPWTWRPNDIDVNNFNAISHRGKLFCPPILTKLILDREPDRTMEWVDRIAQRFDFDHVIPGHLNNYVKADGNEFRRSFDVLLLRDSSNDSVASVLSQQQRDGKSDKRSAYYNTQQQRVLPEDLALLQEASDVLTQLGIVDPSRVCDLELARQVGRFATVAPK